PRIIHYSSSSLFLSLPLSSASSSSILFLPPFLPVRLATMLSGGSLLSPSSSSSPLLPLLFLSSPFFSPSHLSVFRQNEQLQPLSSSTSNRRGSTAATAGEDSQPGEANGEQLLQP
ncbi:hypothetical protein AABB24_000513, partial [Solanum stoloniferum]